MPELPDVEVFRRYFDRHAGGKDVLEAEVYDTRCLEDVSKSSFERRLAGTTFGRSMRRGKQMFVRLGADHWLTLHYGMTGYLVHAAEDEEEPDYTRVAFRLAGGGALYYVLKRMLGRVGLTDSPEQFADDKELGPDAFDLSGADFRELLASVRGKVKSLLMNQARLAGIGNIYSDEMLFQAGIHPDSECRSLDDSARRRLDEARLAVLRAAIDRQADPDAMPGDWLLPHRDDGATCPKCGGTIRRVVISGRGAYLCEGHQKTYSR